MALVVAALATAHAATAQTTPTNYAFGGQMLNNDLLLTTDFASLSQTHAFGTARSMGMGGAFTSLGADLSAMTLNPAGLGMYRRNEVSLTPMLTVAHTETPGTRAWTGDNRTRFSFANIGFALNIYQSASRALTSLTFGFGMNRIADFNSRSSFSSDSFYDPAQPGNTMPSIADVFAQQLQQHRIFPDADGKLGYNFKPYFWPAILGYNGYMVSPYGNEWYPDTIGHNASVVHSVETVTSGSINEFDFSLGANLNNIVYLGATIGFQSIYKKTGITYQEEYAYYGADGQPTAATDKNGRPLTSQLTYSSLYQQMKVDGSGVNFKLGVIVRPIAGLRLGVAFHTPTFYSLDYSYGGDIETNLYNNDTHEDATNIDWTPTQYDEGPNSWNFVSPSRLMFGASYTFGQFAILSVDYERNWYNGIRVKNVPEGADYPTEFYKQEFKQYFKGTNTVRAGLEVKPLPMLAVRLGGGYTDSMFKDRSLFFDKPVTYENYYFSAGLGVTISPTVQLDVAYQNVTDKRTDYQLFFSLDNDTGDWVTNSGYYNTKLTRHYIAMTLGFRF